MLGMTKHEINVTRYGDMADMISCFSIVFGGAKEKKKNRIITRYEEAVKVR